MKNQDLKREMTSLLLRATTASQFVESALALYTRVHPRGSFAELARKMGFQSRSFVRLLALGKRKPNLQNFRRIALGLELSPDETEFLGLLIERSRSPKVTLQIEKRLSEAELKVRRNLQKNVRRIRKTDPVPFERWPFVYAALGSLENGRAFEDIVRISGQGPAVCLKVLDHLVKHEFVVFDSKSQTYRARDTLIDIGELGSSRTLKDLFLHLNIDAARRIESELASERALFHSSVFSVRADRLPELTKELQELLTKYAASAEDSSSETLALLNASLVPLVR